jgi:caffeoyl-CoA O-methyltransferase
VPGFIDEAVERYAEEHSDAEPEHLARLAEETRGSTRAPGMMVGRLEGRFLRMLVAITGAKRILEIGTFTGYSALSMAEALPEGGSIVTCELDDVHAEIARRHIAASEHADRIEIRMGRAADTLKTLSGPFDMVFIDADKGGYREYLEASLPLLSENGFIAVDNVLWSGRVVGEGDGSDDTRAIIAFNDAVANDSRLERIVVPIRDGVTLIRRRRS